MNYKSNDTFFRVFILAISLGLTFNVFPGHVADTFAFIGIGVLLTRLAPPAILASIVIFGEPFFHLFKSLVGLRIAHIFVLLTFAIIITILRFRKNPESRFNQNAVPIYLAIIAFLFILIIHGPIVTSMTERTTATMRNFITYGTYYVFAGIMVARSGVKIRELLLPSILLYCCIFPLIGESILNIPHLFSGMQFGLRKVETFSAIGYSRISGLLVVLAFLAFISSSKKLQIIPEIIAGVIIPLPILWFAYTRQSMLTVFVIIVVIGVLGVTRGDMTSTIAQRVAVLLITLSIVCSAIGWLSWTTKNVKNARVTSANILGGDSRGGRLEVWGQSWEYIKEEPFRGYGLGGYHRLGLGEWPHNWFLEAWLEHGLMVLLLFAAGAIAILRPIFMNSNRWILNWSILGLYWLIVIQFSSNIAQNTLIFFFITLITVSHASSKKFTTKKVVAVKREPAAES